MEKNLPPDVTPTSSQGFRDDSKDIPSSFQDIESNTKLQTSEQVQIPAKTIVGLIIGGVVFIALVVLAVYFLMTHAEQTQQIRDIFIILMALESILVGFVLVILVIQLSRLINLLQHEVKPILESTNETVSTLRGTTMFISEHITEPIIQLNGYLAAMQRLAEMFNLTRGKKK